MRFKSQIIHKMIYHRCYNLIGFSTHIYVYIIMKKSFLFIILLSCTILYGCSKKLPQVSYDFENFHWYFDSENYYDQSTTQLEWQGYQLLQNDIITTYKQKNSSWFINSIIVVKRTSDKTIDEFVSENLKLITNDGFKTENNKNNKFLCNGKSLDINTVNAKVKTNLDTVYLSQSFFKRDNDIYIISFSTLDSEERNSFSENIKHLNCK
jgi:hypothetical protein